MQSKADENSATGGKIIYDMTNEDTNDGDSKLETTITTPGTGVLIGSSRTTLPRIMPSPNSHSIAIRHEIDIPIIDLTSEEFDITQSIDRVEDDLRRIVEVVRETAEQVEGLVTNGGEIKPKEKRARESEVERLVRGSTSMMRAKRVRN